MNFLKTHQFGMIRWSVLLLFLSAFMTRCAHMLSPTGGPRDTIPPVIVKMEPNNFSINRPVVRHEKIYIEFNEFVQLKDQQKEFFTSPQMKKKPLVSLRGRGVVVQLRDTLDSNTTYALNFGGAIRDNNEGNPLNSMRYVFSTGPTIDSMYLSGYTADSYKADSVSKTFIWFFPLDSVEMTKEYDSTIFKHKPTVIARAENNGIFIAQNLKPIDYQIYAVEDKNNNLMYEPGSDQVGFIEGHYNPLRMPDFSIWYDSIRQYVSAEPQIYLRMFTDRAFRRQMLSESSRPKQHQALLYFSTAHPRITNIRFDSLQPEQVIIDPLTEGHDTVALWFHAPSASLPDTLKGEITYFKHDTLNVLREVSEELKLSWRLVESKEEEKEREKLERERKKAEAAGEEWKAPKKKNPFEFKMPTSGEVIPEQHLTAQFLYPLAEIDSVKIELIRTEDPQYMDKKQVLPDAKTRLIYVRDTADLLKWTLKAEWVPGASYQLKIPEGTFVDVAGFKNDSITATYKVAEPEKFATIKIQIKGREDGTRYIIQQLDANNALKQEKRNLTTGMAQFNYVPAGEVKFRIIEDCNANGQWDTGNVVERRQPERAEFYMNQDGEDTFATKANWEMELNMDMTQIFAPVTMETLTKMLDEREAQRLRREAERLLKEGPKNRQKQRERERQEQENRNRSFNSAGSMFQRR